MKIERTPPQLLGFIHELADAAGAAILPHFRSRLDVDNKAGAGGYDPVTVADREAEQAMRRLAKARYPEHGFEGEEFGTDPAQGDYRWVVDPIDGTRAFVLGFPIWGTLIGLMHRDEPVIGMMDQPYMRERFWATSGSGALFRGPDGKERPIATRSCTNVAEAMFTTTHPDLFAPGPEQQGFQRLKDSVRTCRYGGDCYAYCMLAAGHIDVIAETGLKPYDIAALIPIIEAAGGRVTTWEGGSARNGGRVVATGDPTLHDHVLELLR